MFRLARIFFTAVLIASAALARAGELRLVSPANGETLRGGSLAELRWSAEGLPAVAEEWEAFLSVDGGRYYGFRVTPHLDIERRSFTFTVPNFETANARILIRAGDEEHETEFDSETTFSIVRDPNAAAEPPKLNDLEGGEAAREGDPAVIAWTEGERDGSGVTEEMAPVPAPAAASWQPALRCEEPRAVENEDEPRPSPLAQSTRVPAANRLARRPESLPAAAIEVLLICRRLNI
ncbi:MAG TPA: hypothetical protein VE974_15350 [Thermoanaerobaculia bacterium]|nr:hypothetical protein [Thermoanaerobaculia bacterium]